MNRQKNVTRIHLFYEQKMDLGSGNYRYSGGHQIGSPIFYKELCKQDA